MRTLFALTTALGVLAPTLTVSTTNAITTSAGLIETGLASPSLYKDAKLLGSFAWAPVDAIGIPETRNAQPEPAAREASLGQPAAIEDDELAAAAEDDGLPVTVPIERVCEALVDAAVAHSLPIGFFARLIWQESKFDQWARSPVGAQGVAQFMPPTAAEYGLRDPFDPIQSVAASARFLRELREQFGNLGLAAAAYNAGGGRIRKWLNGQSSLPEETRNYVHAITGHPPQRWTVQKPLEVAVALPRRAPCDGIDGLSRDANPAQQDVRLTGLAVELIQQAETARQAAKLAAARAARNKRYAAARTKGRKAAIIKLAGKSKKAKVRVAMVSSR